MILYDPALNMNFRDYGIMLPIAPDRGKQVLEFMNKYYYPGTKGSTMPYPGPVFDVAAALAYVGFADSAAAGKIETAAHRVITREDLERVHDTAFIDGLFDEAGGGLEPALLTTYELIDARGRPNRYEPERAVKPLSSLFQTILAQVGGTYLSCRLALARGPGFCYYMGGGMHHARCDAGSGFCLINDVTVAAMKILSEAKARLIWIIDMDAHKGDGTAELIHFARRNGQLQSPKSPGKGHALPNNADDAATGGKPCVLTLSIHMAKGWPLDAESLAAAREGRAPLIPSDIDIGIDSGEEAAYTPRLAEGIKELERLSAALGPEYNAGKPDLVLVVDGADPYEHDGLPSSGLLKLSLEQCVARDHFVYRYVMDRSLSSAWIQAGGYGDRAWEPVAHFLQRIR